MKSVVIEVKGKNAILLRDDGQVVTTGNNNYSMGDVIIMNNISIKKRVIAMAATAAVFVLLLSAGVFAYLTPYYYVSVDVNPSVLIKANLFERVIGMEAVNEDAKLVVSEINWKHKGIEQVMNETLQELEQEGYFEQAGEVLIASMAKNNNKAEKLADRLSKTTELADVDDARISSEAVGYEMVQFAKELGMTPGKYNLITNLLGEEINSENADAYLNQSVKDLMAEFTSKKGVNGKETAAAAKAKDVDADIVESEDGKQFAEQKRSEAEQLATEQRQEAEQRASEATQAATEQQQEAEQRASEATQAATEQQQEAEQRASEATQAATEQQQQAEQKATEPTQPVNTTNIFEVAGDSSTEFGQPEEITSQTTPHN